MIKVRLEDISTHGHPGPVEAMQALAHRIQGHVHAATIAVQIVTHSKDSTPRGWQAEAVVLFTDNENPEA